MSTEFRFSLPWRFKSHLHLFPLNLVLSESQVCYVICGLISNVNGFYFQKVMHKYSPKIWDQNTVFLRNVSCVMQDFNNMKNMAKFICTIFDWKWWKRIKETSPIYIINIHTYGFKAPQLPTRRILALSGNPSMN